MTKGTVELTFEPSATEEQRAAIRVFMSHFLPLKWTSFTEGPDARIDWKADAVHAEAKLDGGKAAELVLTRNPSATGEGTTVIKNMSYFGSTRNDGFNIMPVEIIAYRRGPKPAPFEFRGTSGWTITIEMNSKDVAPVAAAGASERRRGGACHRGSEAMERDQADGRANR